MGEQLRVRVLGEFRLEGADLVRLRSRKARTMLKVLALQPGRAVSVDALIDAVWNGDLPADPARDLSVLASRARAARPYTRSLRRGVMGGTSAATRPRSTNASPNAG